VPGEEGAGAVATGFVAEAAVAREEMALSVAFARGGERFGRSIAGVGGNDGSDALDAGRGASSKGSGTDVAGGDGGTEGSSGRGARSV
jgi:hypothetical protein